MEEKELFDLANLLVEEDNTSEEINDDGFNPFLSESDEIVDEDETLNEDFFNDDVIIESKDEKDKTVAEKTRSSENVGNASEEKREGTKSPKNDGTSPQNIYSSIAKVLKEEGTFPDLTDDELNKIEDSDSFISAVQQQIKNSIDDEYRRIKSALEVGEDPSLINKYRKAIGALNRITEDSLRDENNAGLRKMLIVQDMINRGYTKERAERIYQRSIDKGDDDIEDAIEAFAANKEFIINKYNSILDEAKIKEQEVINNRNKEIAEFKKTIMEDEGLYGDFNVNKQMRQKIYDSLTKPIYTDKKTGETYTAVQKWELDEPKNFQRVLGLMYLITNGGKDFSNLIKGEVKKKVSKARDEFENALRNTSSNMKGGRLRLANTSSDTESIFKDYSLDI